jgi:hypothetical protein
VDPDVIIVGGELAGLWPRRRSSRPAARSSSSSKSSNSRWAVRSFGPSAASSSSIPPNSGSWEFMILTSSLNDCMGTAEFDREEDHWPRKWAEAYVTFAAGEKAPWLRERGGQASTVKKCPPGR